MPFNAIRENKIFEKLSEFTVTHTCTVLRISPAHAKTQTIGIKHVISCINICRVPSKLFEHDADRSFLRALFSCDILQFDRKQNTACI